MQPHERIAFVKIIADLIDEIELLKVRIEKIEEGRNDRQTLADLIARHFSNDEIDGLVFSLELNGDYEGGTSRAGKARSLVRACEMRSIMPELITLLGKERPKVWKK